MALLEEFSDLCFVIERIPHSRSYQVTEDGLSTALFFTRLTRRVIIPALADITGTGPPPGSPLRQADRAYKTAIADLGRDASHSAGPDLLHAGTCGSAQLCPRVSPP